MSGSAPSVSPMNFSLFKVLPALVVFAVPALAADFNDATQKLIQSPLKTDRQKFYALLTPQLTADERAEARKQMDAARDNFMHPVTRMVMSAGEGQNSWSAFCKSYAEWHAAIPPLLTVIRTDFHKDPKKIAELTRQFEQCDRLRERVRRDADAAEHQDWPRMLAFGATVNELDAQMAKLDGKPFKDSLEDTLLKSVADLTEEMAKVKAMTDWRATQKRYADAETANAACRWAREEQKKFASILNRNRSVVELQPLRLDENLAKCSTDHSVEMVNLKYFSHESPVAANKTFGDRARNASFGGFANGENIFSGSRSPSGAYSAWWASDGHRMIMYMEDANTLGVGTGGTDHWTMNTGKKDWAKAA